MFQDPTDPNRNVSLSMKNLMHCFKHATISCGILLLTLVPSPAGEMPPKVPRFSTDYMDKTVEPAADFFHYANGTWVKNNPVPPDKSRWVSFSELEDRNWFLVHAILDSS